MTKKHMNDSLKLALGLVVSLALLGTTHAAEQTESTSGESSVKVEEIDKPAKDLDEEITNARMRANSGSKSAYSLSFSMAYQGGTLDDPFGAKRPDLYGDPDTPTYSYTTGSFAGRYRMTPNDSLAVGGAYTMYTPLQGNVFTAEEKSKGMRQGTVSNPYISYNRTFAAGKWQHSVNADLTFTTTDASRGINLSNLASIGHTFLRSMESIPLTMGLSTSATYYIYDADPGTFGKPGQANTSEWALGLYPFMEYAFNDTFQFRTVFGYFRWFNRYYDDNKLALINEEPYQSVGLGIVASRDVYIYPNVQFLPGDLDSEKTNFGISATINAF